MMLSLRIPLWISQQVTNHTFKPIMPNPYLDRIQQANGSRPGSAANSRRPSTSSCKMPDGPNAGQSEKFCLPSEEDSKAQAARKEASEPPKASFGRDIFHQKWAGDSHSAIKPELKKNPKMDSLLRFTVGGMCAGIRPDEADEESKPMSKSAQMSARQSAMQSGATTPRGKVADENKPVTNCGYDIYHNKWGGSKDPTVIPEGKTNAFESFLSFQEGGMCAKVVRNDGTLKDFGRDSWKASEKAGVSKDVFAQDWKGSRQDGVEKELKHNPYHSLLKMQGGGLGPVDKDSYEKVALTEGEPPSKMKDRQGNEAITSVGYDIFPADWSGSRNVTVAPEAKTNMQETFLKYTSGGISADARKIEEQQSSVFGRNSWQDSKVRGVGKDIFHSKWAGSKDPLVEKEEPKGHNAKRDSFLKHTEAGITASVRQDEDIIPRGRGVAGLDKSSQPAPHHFAKAKPGWERVVRNGEWVYVR